jgi:hypothetical protein
MESGRGQALRTALAPIVVFACLAAACASPAGQEPTVSDAPAVPAVAAAAEPTPAPTFEIPDVTTRRISRDDLGAMLPPGTRSPLPRTNEDLVMLAVLDREDEASDIVLHGRVTGVGAAYEDPAGARVWIDVLADPDAAHAYLGDTARDISKGVGGTHAPDVAAATTEEFAVEVGDESIGIVAALADGSGTETLIISRAGRLVVFTSYVHGPDDDARVRTQFLAEEVLDGVIGVLTEANIDISAVDVPRYRFQTTTTVSDDGGRTVVTAAGIVDGEDRSCTVDIDGPTGRTTHDLVEVSGIRWWRTDQQGFDRVSPGNLEAAALLLACPAWPLRVDAAGVGPDLAGDTSPARHHVNGVDASGYQSDADGLAAVLGRTAIAADVEGFSFWIADDAPWLVELAISMSGSAAERAALTRPLAEPVGTGSVSVRHRVFDIGGVEESVVPPG